MKLFTTEQVSIYHPDKYADQISDAILNAYLDEDVYSHIACECLVKNNTVIIAGEITSKGRINHKEIVENVASQLGYKVENFIDLISKQSPEINNAVNSDENIGAGDQGIMFGYATSETETYLPLGFEVANKIIKTIELEAYNNRVFKGDAKCQVTVDLDKKGISSITQILVSACHKEEYSIEAVRERLTTLIISVLETYNITLGELGNIKLVLNPSGSWTIGGPTADCGLTGRKIVCDQYGGYCEVGGGAFSGKDPTKVDRSAAYMARVIAVDLVKKFKLTDLKIQLAYAIGIAEPFSITLTKNPIDTNVSEETLLEYIKNNYDLTPKGIINYLGLYQINYAYLGGGNHMEKIIRIMEEKEENEN